MNAQVVPIRSSTQKFIEIVDIVDGIAVFSDGSCSTTISATAVNFGLLSEKEQDAIIYAYAGLLNSLSFPIQIFIMTQQKDISSYLRLLEDQEDREDNPKLKNNIHSYRQFIASTVKEKDVLDKKFYIIIPFSSLELGASTQVLFGSRKKGLPFEQNYIIERANTVLAPKRDHITRLLSRIGLKAKMLDSDALLKLFFTIYNPGQPAPEHAAETIKTTQPTGL